MKKNEFKSQICTTKEQSERLLAFGLKKETADMTWFKRNTSADFECCTSSYTEWKGEILPIADDYTLKDIIPAWSLHRLIEMSAVNDGLIMMNVAIPIELNFYDEVVNIIENLIKDNLFNPQFLEEKQ